LATTDDLTIRGFADAIATTIGLRARFRRAHAVAALDADGRVRDLTAFTARRHTIDDALQWAWCESLGDERVTKLVLLSVGRRDVEELSEDDLATFRRARATFAADGVAVVDWIQYDGHRFRSFAFTIGGGEAWDAVATDGHDLDRDADRDRADRDPADDDRDGDGSGRR
jgi:hypothetical protein